MRKLHKSLGAMAQRFGQESVKAQGINLTWIDVMGLAIIRLGVLKKDKWHSVEFYIKDLGGGEFSIDEFRIRTVPNAKKKKVKKGRSKAGRKFDQHTKLIRHNG